MLKYRRLSDWRCLRADPGGVRTIEAGAGIRLVLPVDHSYREACLVGHDSPIPAIRPAIAFRNGLLMFSTGPFRTGGHRATDVMSRCASMEAGKAVFTGPATAVLREQSIAVVRTDGAPVSRVFDQV